MHGCRATPQQHPRQDEHAHVLVVLQRRHLSRCLVRQFVARRVLADVIALADVFLTCLVGAGDVLVFCEFGWLVDVTNEVREGVHDAADRRRDESRRDPARLVTRLLRTQEDKRNSRQDVRDVV